MMEVSTLDNIEKTIIVDIDGVLANTHEIVIDHLNTNHGICMKYTDIIGWEMSLPKRLSLTKEIIEVLCTRDLAWKIPKIEGSLEGMNMLKSMGFHITIATSRGSGISHYTQEWLIEYPYEEIYFEQKKYELDADFLVDDHTAYIYDFVKDKNRVGILMNRPWNVLDRDVLSEYHDEGFVFYADTWADIIAILSGWKFKQEKKDDVPEDTS